ncbi:MAG: hypothetical protein AB7U29_18885 [Desulfobulbus sp.]
MAFHEEWSKIDGELFEAYKQRFGMVCSFTAPDLTADHFNALFRRTLETGVEIDYVKEGWENPESYPVDSLI